MFQWIKKFSLVAIVTLSPTIALANAMEDRYDSFSLGYAIGSDNGSFSTGIEATSPWFLDSRLALQAKVFQSWFTHAENETTGEESWLPFTSYKLGVMGGSLSTNNFMRMYGAGGFLLIVPNAKMSAKKSALGSYGAFGFEFLSGHSLNYYIELGANGISAHADKQPRKPIYSNGFSTVVGFRYYL